MMRHNGNGQWFRFRFIIFNQVILIVVGNHLTALFSPKRTVTVCVMGIYGLWHRHKFIISSKVVWIDVDDNLTLTMGYNGLRRCHK